MVPADPVSAALGKFGAWQARSLLLLALVKIPAGWHMLSILFLAPNPETFGGCFLCARENSSKISLNEWIQTRHPVDQRYPLGFDPCNIYPVINGTVFRTAGSLQECNKFEFIISQPTMVSQWSLVCKRGVLVSVIQLFYLLGITSGGVVTFILLKSISPKMIITVGTALQVSAGIAGSLQPIFEVHCFLKMLIGLGTCLMFTAATQIIVDISIGWRKTVFSVCFELFWSIGVMSLGWLDAAANSWSTLHLIISVPSILFLVMWCSAGCPRQKLPVFKVICLQFMWIGTVVFYYGALLNIKNVGGPTLPIRTTIAGAAEIIGMAIGVFLLLNPKHKFGILSLLLLIGGASCASSFAIPPNESGSTGGWTMLWLAIGGRISVACSLAVMSNGSLELLPADKRAVVGTAMVTVARMVLMTAPFLNNLAFYGESITLTFYGCLALIAACGAFCLYVSAEWRVLLGPCNKKEFSPQGESRSKPSEAENVVCVNFNQYCIHDAEFETNIAA